MKFLKRMTMALMVFAFCLQAAACAKAPGSNNSDPSSDGGIRIVSSFYPMHIIALNLCKGIEGVSAVSMSDPNMGCIHDHVFSTEDLKKIEGADIYIENGLDLETFNEKLLAVYPNIKIIVASEQVTDAVSDGDEENGHVWTSIDDYILEIEAVASGLRKYDPDHFDEYRANEKAYLEKIEKLKTDNADIIESMKGEKALVLDETLPSFCTFLGMKQISIETDHEQEALSAGDIQDAIEEMKSENIKIIFVGKDADTKVSDAIRKETGAKVYALNSCMTGEEEPDSYLKQMQENFDILAGR